MLTDYRALLLCPIWFRTVERMIVPLGHCDPVREDAEMLVLTGNLDACL